jgi:uridine phosphorylase
MYPILEFDETPDAIIMPTPEPGSQPETDCCVICFSHEVVSRVAQETSATVIAELKSVAGPIPIYEAEFGGKPTGFCIGGVGAPLASAVLENAIAIGYRRFIACGSCGVIDSTIPSRHLLIPTAAIRDDGTSYHYAPPSERIEAQEGPVGTLTTLLDEMRIPFDLVTTWTTDAFYRETRERIARRAAQGCSVVEMEAAALFAVSRFRHAQLGQILYAGDDVGGETWDRRDWQLADGHTQTRIFELAISAVHRIPEIR